MFACAFDLPLGWFFIPPPGDTRRFRGTSDHVPELFSLFFGRQDQVELIHERYRELGYKDPSATDVILERTGLGVVPENYKDRRKELLLDLVDHRADELDKVAAEMGKFFDYLHQLGVKGMLAAKLVDRDFAAQPEDRGTLSTDGALSEKSGISPRQRRS